MGSFSKSNYDAVIVGSGPNGLAAAIECARSGLSTVIVEKSETLGGGMRTEELMAPGFIHDVFSAVHPMGVASPFFKSLPLAEHGLKWIHTPAAIAHPFDDGSAAIVRRSVAETARGLGSDQVAYQNLFTSLVSRFGDLMSEILASPLHVPKHPLLLAQFGLKSLRSAEAFARIHFQEEKSRALFMGNAAHSSARLTEFASSAVGFSLQIAAHGGGWPFPEGGSQSIARALVSYFQSLGGEVVTGLEIKSVHDLPTNRLVIFDLTPRQILKIAGSILPASVAAHFREFRYGPGVFKMDWALHSPIPWKNPQCAESATVHLGGSASEMIASEEDANFGRISQKPFVLLTQPSLFDSTRAPAGKHTAWAYCHVPPGSNYDMSEIMENQIERFAPGFKRTILHRHRLFSRDLEARNPNLIGGDISGGLVASKQLFFRPRVTLNPYELDGKKYWIGSSSTPPGPAVHGMCGFHAARAAMRKC